MLCDPGVSKKEARQSGQSLVEFALIIPLFCALVFGIIDLGWMGYQVASFDYGYMNASWDVAASTMVDYDYGATVTGDIATDIASEVIKDEIAAVAVPGFDVDCLHVDVTSASLSNSPSTYTVPDRNGEAAEASSVQRMLNVQAQLTYQTKPLVGFSLLSTTVSKNLSFDRVVGVEHRAQ